MAIFIPRREWYSDKKPGSAIRSVERNSPLVALFNSEFVSEIHGISPTVSGCIITELNGELAVAPSSGVSVLYNIENSEFWGVVLDFTLTVKDITSSQAGPTILNIGSNSIRVGPATGYIVNETITLLDPTDRIGIGPTINQGRHRLVLYWDGTEYQFCLDGQRIDKLSSSSNSDIPLLQGSTVELIGYANSTYPRINTHSVQIYSEYIGDVAVELSANPYQLLKPQQIWFPVTSGAGGGVNLTPTQASSVFSGQTPDLSAGHSTTTVQGSFSFTGLTPSLGVGNAVNLTPTQALFTFTGLTPIENIGYTDTAIQGSFTFTGLNSSLSSGFVESPIQLSNLWSGQIPSLDSGAYLQAVQGAQSFSGLTPSLLSGYIDTATQATFLFVGGTPSANIGGGINLTPAQGSFAFTGLNPAPSYGQVHTPTQASFSFTGLVPSLQAGDAINLTPAQGSFTFTGLTSTIALGFSNTPTQASFLWSGLVPSTTLVPSEVTLSQASIDAIADAVWQKAIETYTAEEMMRVFMSALSGKREGLGTATERYMSVDGSKPRITLTADQNGNGTPVIDGSA